MKQTPGLSEYVVYLPLCYNDGSKIEEEKIEETIEEVIGQFGAFTREKANEGVWIYKNEVYADWIDKIQVLAYDTGENDAWFKRFRRKLEERFRQEKIFVTKRSGIEVL